MRSSFWPVRSPQVYRPFFLCRESALLLMFLTGFFLLMLALVAPVLHLQQRFAGVAGRQASALTIAAAGLSGLLLVLAGRPDTPFIQLWVPPWDWRQHSYPMMLMASILGAGALLKGGHISARLQHPGSLAVLIWGLAHLLTNGDLISCLLFGGVSLAALLRIGRNWLHDKSGDRTVSGSNRAEVRYEALPPVSVHRDIAAIIAGLAGWSLLTVYHGPLFGVALDLFR